MSIYGPYMNNWGKWLVSLATILFIREKKVNSTYFIKNISTEVCSFSKVIENRWKYFSMIIVLSVLHHFIVVISSAILTFRILLTVAVLFQLINITKMISPKI